MVDQASDSSHHPCDYAACTVPAAGQADGWHFCPRHLTEHRYIMAGEELPDLRRRDLPPACGTEGGHKAHRRRGESPCLSCRSALVEASRRRNAANGDRWHRRAAS